MPRVKYIDDAIRWIIIACFGLIPVFFLPLTQEFYETNKFLLLVVSVGLIILLWSVRAIAGKTISVSSSRAGIGFIALSGAALVSLIFSSTNKVEAAASPNNIFIFVSFAIIFLFGSHLFDRKYQRFLRWGIFGSVALLSLIGIYQFFGLGKLLFPDVKYIADMLWSPEGSALGSIAAIIIILPLLVDEFLYQKEKKNDTQMAIAAVIGVISLFSVGLTLFHLIPILATSFLPYNAAWVIFLEVFKVPKMALFGIGTENYLMAFTAGRPISMNTGLLWNTRFSVSSSAILQIGTTLGLIGLTAVVVFLRCLLSPTNQKPRPAYRISLILGILALFLLPPQITIWTLIAALLLLSASPSEKEYTWTIPPHISWIGLGIGSAGALIVLIGVTGLYHYYGGELIFYKSLVAAAANRGTETYNLQIQALKINPNISNYHVTYSQTNLALANSIATAAQKAKADSKDTKNTNTLSDADRTTISQLIQQSIQEAKIATSLTPGNIIAWETLANTYQNITGAVQGADGWATAAYQQAAQLDPTNPFIRLSLASISMNAQDWDTAIQQLQAAISLKPDLPAAHYNLAVVYRQRKEFLKEAQALKNTLALLPANSPDVDKVKKEYEDAKKNLKPEELKILEPNTQTNSAQDNTSLELPQSSPAAVITPKLEIPQEASNGPVRVVQTPKPTIQPTPSPTLQPNTTP
jgi:tetratricopeptide (TPR) repeat protein